MSHNMKSQGEPGYKYIAVSANEIDENGFEIIDAIACALDDNESDRILIDLRDAKGRMPLSQAYEIVSTYSKLAPRRNIKTAVVEFSDDPGYISSYELAAGKHGYRISFFADFREAVSWLLV